MTGPGIYSYSTTPANNVQANTGINWDEGMSPAAVNNSARQNMTDMRNAFNDLIWFKYGKGDLDYSPVYASGTTFTIAGADLTVPYHIGRRVKAVGSSTGTIYGTISATAFSTNTTVTVVWDSGSLSNETLTISLSQIPVTGDPSPCHIAFSTYPTGASQSISSSTWTKVTLGTEEFDVGGFFDSATNYRFQPTVAGYYQINGRVSFSAIAVGYTSLCAIYKTGTRYKRGSSVNNQGSSSAVHASEVCSVVYLNGSTDYVELFCIQTTAGAVNIDGSTTEDTYLNGALLFPA